MGRPTKAKSTNYISETFGYDQMKSGNIRIHQFVREGSNNSNSSLGKKTYQEWKDQGMKLHRVVFLMQGEILAKVIFSPVATKPIGLSITNNTSFQITASSQLQLNKEFSTVDEIED